MLILTLQYTSCMPALPVLTKVWLTLQANFCNLFHKILRISGGHSPPHLHIFRPRNVQKSLSRGHLQIIPLDLPAQKPRAPQLQQRRIMFCPNYQVPPLQPIQSWRKMQMDLIMRKQFQIPDQLLRTQAILKPYHLQKNPLYRNY